MNDFDETDAHVSLRSTDVMPGCAYGLRHPSLLAELAVGAETSPERLAEVEVALAGAGLDESSDAVRPKLPPGLGERGRPVTAVLYWLDRVQRAARVPVFEPARILYTNLKTSSVMVALPTQSRTHRVTEETLAWLTRLFADGCAGRDLRAHLEKLPERLRQLEQTIPRRSNTPRFLEAAFALGIPYQELPGEVFRFGYGAKARVLDSTFTDQTPQIGVRWARSKSLTSAVLRDAGIPVPEQRSVRSIAEAMRAARDLGFPVVVKAADLTGGVGVFPGLTTPDEVHDSFLAAQRESARILVEKHAEGRDYRLLIHQGEVISTVERIPGGVTGDGTNTVQSLLDRVNEDPRRGDGPHAPLHRLVFDDEARLLLEKAGMALDSVPGPGVFVRLRRTANVARGGMPVPVLEPVHPDNTLLAVRAASALGLDLAGIDLLMPEIQRSWRDCGAAVCEVNGQPHVGSVQALHLYGQLLRRLVRGSGRVPIAVVVGAAPGWNLAAALAKRLGSAGLVTGRSDHEGVTIGRVTITAAVPRPYAAGRILAGERGVDAIVLCIADTAVLGTGLPFDRFDVLVFAGPVTPVSEAERRLPPDELLLALFRLLAPNCAGSPIVVAEPGADARALFGSLPVEVSKATVASSRALEKIAKAMIEAGRRHRGQTTSKGENPA